MSRWSSLKRFWTHRYGHARFRLMDINCVAYLGLIGFFLIFFHQGVEHWFLFILIHAVLIAGILEIVRLGEIHPQKKVFWIFRVFYPVPLFLFLWGELESLVPMIFGNYWATDMIVRWDELFFGVHPTVWVQQFYTPWLNELINFLYAGYYTFFLVVPISLFLSKRKEETFSVFSVATFVYFSNFILFFFLPAYAPQHIPWLQKLHTHEMTGFLFVEINRIIQSQGAVHGACFPSSHVAGAFAWVFLALRYIRKLGYALIPVAIGVAFGTVYMKLHHAVDPIIGIIWGVIAYGIAMKILRRRNEDPLRRSEK